MEGLARSSGVSVAKERMKNLLFNYYDALVQAAVDNVSLREEVKSLDEALQEADKENDELRKVNGTKEKKGNGKSSSGNESSGKPGIA